MTNKQVTRRIELILAYEPSWFAEVASAVGIFCWGLFCFLTDDYAVSGDYWVLPVVAMVFGPIRAWLLFRVWPGPRVVAAMLGFVWWGWIYYSMFRRWGAIPAQGAMIGCWVADVLTCGKFSLMVLKANRDDEADRKAGIEV